MLQIRNLLAVILVIAIIALSQSLALAQMTTSEKMTNLLGDMWNYYDVFSKLQNDPEREDLAKQMESTADKILEYYKNSQNPDSSQIRLTAQAFLLLAIAEYQIDNPTWTSQALQTVKETNWGVVGDIDPTTNRSFKERVDGIDTVWLPKFKKCTGQVYGFPENTIWGQLEVKIWPPLYLDIIYRTEENFKAIKGAQDYLNSEIRGGSKEITLLLPPGKYQLEGGDFAIYPAQFEVKEGSDSIIVCKGAKCITTVQKNPPPTIFDITPDEYFNLRVFYCRDSIAIKIDTVVREVQKDTLYLDDTSSVYRELPKNKKYLVAEVTSKDSLVKNISHNIEKIPVEPRDLSIWKGNKQILNFNHLAYGVYELRDAKKFGIADEYKFKRFLPEGIKWDMPKNEKFKAEDIYVRSGKNYDYCIDLSKPTSLAEESHKETTPEWCREVCKKYRCRSVWDSIFSSAFMGVVFYFYLDTIR